MRYRLISVGECPDHPGRWSRLLDIDNNQFETDIGDLLPYSRYQVKVWARTSAGRGQAAVVNATTATAGLLDSLYVLVPLCLILLLLKPSQRRLLKISRCI